MPDASIQESADSLLQQVPCLGLCAASGTPCKGDGKHGSHCFSWRAAVVEGGRRGAASGAGSGGGTTQESLCSGCRPTLEASTSTEEPSPHHLN
eukprot:2329065-Pleurochrysis_carterae.AAC.2